jgi:hypothetical protein
MILKAGAGPTAEEFMRADERGKPSARRVSHDDGLEQLIGPKTLFSIEEFANLIDRSPATVWRLLRMKELTAVPIGGSKCIPRGEALRFLRHGGRTAA